MKTKRLLWRLAFVLCLTVFAVSSALFIRERVRENAFDNYVAALQATAVNRREETLGTPQESIKPLLSLESSDKAAETAPIGIDFESLRELNGDVVAWLYCEDTPINYPVAQGGDNDAYLRHLLDGKYDAAGSLFVDYRNAECFSDWNTVVYGHNMKNETMFGTLDKYKGQAYYDAHPFLYLLTPDADYRVELLGGFVTDAGADLYTPAQTQDDAQALVREMEEKSTFRSTVLWDGMTPLITLSTCSYEFDSARYVLIGVLIPLLK